MNHYKSTPAVLCGQTIYIKFSDKNELTAGRAPGGLIQPTGLIQSGAADGPRRVLLVTLDGLNQAISIDDIFTLFNPYGPVQKISTFAKNGKNQVWEGQLPGACGRRGPFPGRRGSLPAETGCFRRKGAVSWRTI